MHASRRDENRRVFRLLVNHRPSPLNPIHALDELALKTSLLEHDGANAARTIKEKFI